MIKVTTEKFSIEADTLSDVHEVMDMLAAYSFSRYLVPAASESIPFLRRYEEKVRNSLPNNRKLSASLINAAIEEFSDHYIEQPFVNGVGAKRLAKLAIIVICRRLGFNDSQIEEASGIKQVAKKIYDLRHNQAAKGTKEYTELVALLDGNLD